MIPIAAVVGRLPFVTDGRAANDDATLEQFAAEYRDWWSVLAD